MYIAGVKTWYLHHHLVVPQCMLLRQTAAEKGTHAIFEVLRNSHLCVWLRVCPLAAILDQSNT